MLQIAVSGCEGSPYPRYRQNLTQRGIIMKKLTFLTSILLAAALGFSAPLMAAHHEGSSDEYAHDSGKKCPKKMGRISEKLGLDDDQKARFAEIMEAKHTRKKEIIEASGIKESLEQLHDETHEKLKSVLSEEQMEKFEKMKEKRHDKHKSHKCKH